MSDVTLRQMSAAGVAQAHPAADIGVFIALLKPRVMSLVVFSGAAGLLVAPGTIHPVIAAVAVLCIAVGAGAAGAINMWYERDIDALMARTRDRPVPRGEVAPEDALGFGIALSLFSVMIMGLAVNWVAAALLAFANAFYVFVYTMWLKRRTPQNIVIGGAAGAFPPMIGWAAVTGGVSVESLTLFLIIFLWTPPHFWALALYRDGDYAKAGIPMLPVVAGRWETRKQILAYTILLALTAVAPSVLGFAGLFYATVAALFSALFVVCAVRLLRADDDRRARQMFGFSILYLFMIFTALVVDGTSSGFLGMGG